MAARIAGYDPTGQIPIDYRDPPLDAPTVVGAVLHDVGEDSILGNIKGIEWWGGVFEDAFAEYDEQMEGASGRIVHYTRGLTQYADQEEYPPRLAETISTSPLYTHLVELAQKLAVGKQSKYAPNQDALASIASLTRLHDAASGAETLEEYVRDLIAMCLIKAADANDNLTTPEFVTPMKMVRAYLLAIIARQAGSALSTCLVQKLAPHLNLNNPNDVSEDPLDTTDVDQVGRLDTMVIASIPHSPDAQFFVTVSTPVTRTLFPARNVRIEASIRTSSDTAEGFFPQVTVLTTDECVDAASYAPESISFGTQDYGGHFRPATSTQTRAIQAFGRRITRLYNEARGVYVKLMNGAPFLIDLLKNEDCAQGHVPEMGFFNRVDRPGFSHEGFVSSLALLYPGKIIPKSHVIECGIYEGLPGYKIESTTSSGE